MPKPQYPTQEGIWSQGQRPEDNYKGVKLGLPFQAAVESLRGALQNRGRF